MRGAMKHCRSFVAAPALVVLVLAALVACGGDDDDGGGAQATPSGGDGNGAATEAGDGDAGAGSGSNVELGEVPPPGEARLEVGDDVFVFLESEAVSARIFHCEITEEFVTINFQSDENDMTVQGSARTGEWILNVAARPRDGGGSYGSIGGDFVTEGSSLVYVGEFTFSPDEDRADFEELGEGRVAVTCP